MWRVQRLLASHTDVLVGIGVHHVLENADKLRAQSDIALCRRQQVDRLCANIMTTSNEHKHNYIVFFFEDATPTDIYTE